MANQQTRLELLRLKELRKKKMFRMRDGILISEKELEDRRREHCPGCGGRLVSPKIYFGENFCEPCIFKFTLGKK